VTNAIHDAACRDTLRAPDDLDDNRPNPADLTLAQCEAEVLSLHDGFCLRTTFDRAHRIGKLLKRIRDLLPHGQYTPYLKRMGINPRTAQVYCQIAAAPDPQLSAGLTIDSFLALRSKGKRALRKEESLNLPTRCPDRSIRERIILGDALEWLRDRDEATIEFFCTDPPYGLGKTYGGTWREPSDAETYWTWLQPFWAEMQRVLVPGGAVVMMQSYRHLPIIWPRLGAGVDVVAACHMTRTDRQWEPIVHWIKPGSKPIKRLSSYNDYLTEHEASHGESPYADRHPCITPLSVARALVTRYTVEGALVADPFCGTGAIQVACAQLGRDYLGIERHKEYVRLARGRLAQVESRAG
jgi:hypothetical protein